MRSRTARFGHRGRGAAPLFRGACVALAALTPIQARAQESGESRLHAELEAAIAELQRAEIAAVQNFGDGSLEQLNAAAPVIQEHAQRLTRVRALLDTVVFTTPTGPEYLARLRARYPSSALFELVAARLFVGTGRADSALIVLERVAFRMPASLDVQVGLADAHEALGDTAEAIRALTRALEIEPSDEAIFERLLALRRAEDSLNQLLAQVRRLQLRLPDARRLIEREVELLHRLGRLDEARTAAARLREEEGA